MNEDVMNQLKDMQARLQAMAPAAVPPMAPMSFAQAQPPMQPMIQQPMQASQFPGGGGAGSIQPTGLLVAINIPTPEGEATCHLQFGPEAAANPQAVIMQLLQAGWPLKIWRGNGGGGGFNRGYGGGGGAGGGFNRGFQGRRW